MPKSHRKRKKAVAATASPNTAIELAGTNAKLEDLRPEKYYNDEEIDDDDYTYWYGDDRGEFPVSRNIVAPSRRFLLTLAKKAFQRLIDTAVIDQSTGELVLTAETTSGVMFQERVHSKIEFEQFFREFGFNDYSKDLEPIFGYGSHTRIDELDRSVVDKITASEAVEQLFRGISSPGTTLFTNSGSLLLPSVKVELASVNDELLKFLAANPNKLHTLEPRRFEELIADIFRDFGYEVILTPRSRDGGHDIRAIRKDSVGMLLYLIECKKYAPQRPVGVDVVRGLYGVTTAEGASCGIIATTSRFTRDAEEFADKIRYKMSLRDFNHLVGWLKQYPVSKSRALKIGRGDRI